MFFRGTTDLVYEDSGKVEPVAVDTLPGQPERESELEMDTE